MKSSIPSKKVLLSSELKNQKLRQKLSQYNLFNATLNNDSHSTLPKIKSQESLDLQDDVKNSGRGNESLISDRHQKNTNTIDYNDSYQKNSNEFPCSRNSHRSREISKQKFLGNATIMNSSSVQSLNSNPYNQVNITVLKRKQDPMIKRE